MEQTGFIAAIDLGSSKIIVMVAKKNQEGKLSILDKEEIESGNCIRRGRIYNLEETKNKIREVILKIENRLPQKIEKLYVGIGGQSLQTATYPIIKDFSENENSTITKEILQSLREKCEPDLEVLEDVSADYYLDNQDQSEVNPIGMTCSSIETHFKLIVAKPVKKILEDSLEKSRTSLAGYVISPMATANSVLNHEEKKNGCALVEIGAAVTYLSIYQQGILKELVTIPLGGSVITKDISSLNISMKEAENLKIKYGSAISDPEEGSKIIPITNPEPNGPKEMELRLLEEIIEARANEIIVNVDYQLKSSEYGKNLNAGIILTGGSSLLHKIAAAFRNKTKLDVRLATPNHRHFQKIDEQYTNNPAYAEVIGILLAGTENCAKEKEIVVTPPVTTSTSPAKEKQQGSLFNPDDIDTKPPVSNPKPAKGNFITRMIKKGKDSVDNASKSLFDEENFNNDTEK